MFEFNSKWNTMIKFDSKMIEYDFDLEGKLKTIVPYYHLNKFDKIDDFAYSVYKRFYGRLNKYINEKMDAKFYRKKDTRPIDKKLIYNEFNEKHGFYTGGYVIERELYYEIDKYTIDLEDHYFDYVKKDYVSVNKSVVVIDDNCNNDALLLILNDREQAKTKYGSKFLLRVTRLLWPEKFSDKGFMQDEQSRQINWTSSTYWFIVDLDKPYNEVLYGDFVPSYKGFGLSAILSYYVAYYRAVEAGLLNALNKELKIEAEDINKRFINQDEIDAYINDIKKIKTQGFLSIDGERIGGEYAKYQNDFEYVMKWVEYKNIPENEKELRNKEPYSPYETVVEVGNFMEREGVLFRAKDYKDKEEFLKVKKRYLDNYDYYSDTSAFLDPLFDEPDPDWAKHVAEQEIIDEFERDYGGK